jgi:phosphomannomutase/phosphoglucomutase
MKEGEHHDFVAEMQEKARFSDAKITTIDGVRADFADGWGLVRASNTTPVLVLRFDADSEAALQRIKGVFKQQMLAIDSKLNLPF